MNRYRVLEAPHKGIRHLLGEWALVSGNADASCAADIDALQSLTRLCVTLLEDHARNEDAWILPLLEATAPGSTHELDVEHQLMDESLIALSAQICAFDPDGHGSEQDRAEEMDRLHREVTRFQARYLLHMYEEEATIHPALWDGYTDEELREAEARVAVNLDPALLLEWFRVCAPARPVADMRAVLQGLQPALPQEAFDGILAVLDSSMSEDRLHRIVDDL